MRQRFKFLLLCALFSAFSLGAFFIMIQGFYTRGEYSWVAVSLGVMVFNANFLRMSLRDMFLCLDDAILWK